MKTNKAIAVYLIGVVVQIGCVCSIIGVLRWNQINSNQFSILFLAIAGTSTAIWGGLVSKLIGKIKNYKEISKAFFKVREPLKYYVMIGVFLIIIFGKQLVYREVLENTMWYTFIFVFLKAILFGGIEEIGWRYTYQPMLEKYMTYELASLCTFLSWAIWHYMFFYVVNTIQDIKHLPFLLGLLVSSFVLGAIYYITKSLWLCVLFHVMINVFSQTLAMASILQTFITAVICIMASIMLVKNKKGNYLLYKYKY